MFRPVTTSSPHDSLKSQALTRYPTSNVKFPEVHMNFPFYVQTTMCMQVGAVNLVNWFIVKKKPNPNQTNKTHQNSPKNLISKQTNKKKQAGWEGKKNKEKTSYIGRPSFRQSSYRCSRESRSPACAADTPPTPTTAVLPHVSSTKLSKMQRALPLIIEVFS